MSIELPLSPATGVLAARAPGGFVAATWRRIGPPQLLRGAIVVAAAVALGSMSRLHWFRPFALNDDFQRMMLLADAGMTCAVLLALVAADEAVSRGAPRWPSYLGAVFAACLAATALLDGVAWLLGWMTGRAPPISLGHPWWSATTFLSGWLYGTLGGVVYANRRIAAEASALMHEAELARVASRRRTLESRLQAMQARVEPQFLFDTLAQVRELFERDTELGGRMLEDLIAYLRAALPHLRESSSTLGQELRLVQAYLDILEIRLGDGLAFTVEPAGACAGAPLPPMLLLPVIDHVLMHGAAAPSPRREIRVATRATDGRLRVTVACSGDALGPGIAAPGLDGIEQRLQALFGDAARFERADSGGQGSHLSMDLPHAVPGDRTGDPGTPSAR